MTNRRNNEANPLLALPIILGIVSVGIVWFWSLYIFYIYSQGMHEIMTDEKTEPLVFSAYMVVLLLSGALTMAGGALAIKGAVAIERG